MHVRNRQSPFLLTMKAAVLVIFSMTLWGFSASNPDCQLPTNMSEFSKCSLTDCPPEEEKLLKCSCRIYLDEQPLLSLGVEYTSFGLGSVQIVGNDDKPSSLVHQHGLLVELPDNLCHFPHLVQLDLSYNALSRLDGLWCLAQLDTLRLSYNLLGWLDNATFGGLAMLRELYLDHNNIAHLGLNSFSLATPFLQRVDLSDNQLMSLDISNWNFSNPFCLLSVTHNALVELTNNLSMSIIQFEHKGPGYVDLQYNNFTEFMNWTDLKVGNITDLSAFLEWGIDFRNNYWTCDCWMYSFIGLTSRFYQSVRRDFHDVQCFNPPHLRGQLVKSLDQNILRCNISENCPLDSCLCYFQSSQVQTFVQCANSLLTRLPDVLPNFLQNGAISLDLSGSPITQLAARPYLRWVVHLNLSHTDITSFPEDIVPLLNPDVKIDLTGTRLTSLPRSLLAKVPARNLNVTLTFLECHCNLTFVETWLAQVGRNLSSSQCWQQGRRRGAEEVLQECRRPDSTLVVVGVSVGSVAALVLLLTGLSYVFRFELAVLAHRLFFGRSMGRLFRKQIHVEKMHDVFISVAEDLRPLVLRQVWPRLMRQGFTVFIPDLHVLPGAVTREASLEALSCSRLVVVVASQAYLGAEDKQHELQDACNVAFRHWDARLTLVQPGRLPHSNKFLRAMTRLGMAGYDVSAEGIASAIEKDGAQWRRQRDVRARYRVQEDFVVVEEP